MSKWEIEDLGEFRNRCKFPATSEEFVTDVPKDAGGKGTHFSPTDLVGAALGACVMSLIEMQAKGLRVELKNAKLSVTKEMAKAPPRRIAKIVVHFTCDSVFSEEITKKLENAATHCPVHMSLHPEVVQEFIFKWGS